MFNREENSKSETFLVYYYISVWTSTEGLSS